LDPTAAGLAAPVAHARPAAGVPQEPTEALYAWRTPNLLYHNAGLLEMMVTNLGLVGSLNASRASAVWFDGEYLNLFAAVLDSVPVGGSELQAHCDVGRYFYVDTMGLKNGMIYVYDVTPYSCWYESGEYMELTTQPAALEAEGVRPSWSAVTSGDWRSQVRVVPNPWHGGADWDLIPSDADPTGTHIDFAYLPDRECTIRIYSLSGDLVQILEHDGSRGRGTARWNLLSRRGQDIAPGIYLYTITCGDETKIGRFTVTR
jgi:hypothetical protein